MASKGDEMAILKRIEGAMSDVKLIETRNSQELLNLVSLKKN